MIAIAANLVEEHVHAKEPGIMAHHSTPASADTLSLCARYERPTSKLQYETCDFDSTLQRDA